MPRAYFNHVIYKELEGRQFQVMNMDITNTELQYYGDYMKLLTRRRAKATSYSRSVYFVSGKGRFNSALFSNITSLFHNSNNTNIDL